VRRAATALLKEHGERARHYLTTIAAYNGEAWPGLREVLTES
jgi:hypothetical protein